MAATGGATAGGAVGGAAEADEDEAVGGTDDEAGPDGPPELGSLPVDEEVAIVKRD